MNIPILMYHQIDERPPRGTPLRGLVVSPSSFARQMWLLKFLGYKGLSMRDLEPYLEGRQRGRVVGITFDDGYQNNIDHALPILIKHGFTATCYAVSSMLGGTNIWDRDIGVPTKKLMTPEDWKTWFSTGMDVGSHTCTHADLNQLSADEARLQISQSKYALERLIGSPVRHFCYPFGRFRAEHATMAKDAGYVTATTTRRGRIQDGTNPFTLSRVMVAGATSLLQFTLKIATKYEDRKGN